MRLLSFGSKQTNAVLTIVCGLLVVVVGLFAILSGFSSYKSTVVETHWAGTLGSREEILERYPSRDADENALRLESLAARLGIDLATREGQGRSRPTPEAAKVFAEVAREATSYHRHVLEQSRRRIVAPPPVVTAFLEARSSELAAIRDHLIKSGAPQWERRIELVSSAPIPNLRGHVDLQRLLITDALAELAVQNRQYALWDLESAWNLLQSFRDSPYLIVQLIVIDDARLLVGVLRQIENPPPIWRERILQADFRESFTNALNYEGWYWTQLGGLSDLSGLTGIVNRVGSRVAMPYVRLCLADISDTIRRRIENIEGVAGICDYDLSTGQAYLDLPVSSWNLFGEIASPSMSGSLERLARLELDLELTEKLLELQERSAAGGPGWPAAFPDLEASQACPRDHWLYAVTPRGKMTLALDREITWSGIGGPNLPTRFTLSH